ncbi:hypothetical protein [Kingella sp. (in: b-proteobacteria)]|nr:hypothetical protein [Kingella sp. (in: b-proteobacteria)]MDO4658618.1 hypothetical protein [Kingella sp. (in: b-proteobacteria)]
MPLIIFSGCLWMKLGAIIRGFNPTFRLLPMVTIALFAKYLHR